MDDELEHRFATLLKLIQESQGHTAQALDALKAMLGVVADMKEAQAEIIARIEALEQRAGTQDSTTTH